MEKTTASSPEEKTGQKAELEVFKEPFDWCEKNSQDANCKNDFAINVEFQFL